MTPGPVRTRLITTPPFVTAASTIARLMSMRKRWNFLTYSQVPSSSGGFSAVLHCPTQVKSFSTLGVERAISAASPVGTEQRAVTSVTMAGSCLGHLLGNAGINHGLELNESNANLAKQ